MFPLGWISSCILKGSGLIKISQNAFGKGTYTIKHISNYTIPYIYINILSQALQLSQTTGHPFLFLNATKPS